MKFLLSCLLLALFAGCGHDETLIQGATLNSKLGDELLASEAALSFVTNDLWVVNAPPSPGRLYYRPCVQSTCKTEELEGGTRLQTIFNRQSRACSAGTAVISGNTTTTVTAASTDLSGCATAVGPPHFSRWPPRDAVIGVRVGGVTAESATGSVGAGTFEHRDSRNGSSRRTSGEATIRFSSAQSDVGIVELNFSANGDGALQHHIHTLRDDRLFFTMPSFSDFSARVLNGAFHIDNKITASADALVFRKSICCHPIGGRLILTRQEKAPLILDFDNTACGEAWLHEPPGSSYRITFKGCSS